MNEYGIRKGGGVLTQMCFLFCPVPQQEGEPGPAQGFFLLLLTLRGPTLGLCGAPSLQGEGDRRWIKNVLFNLTPAMGEAPDAPAPPPARRWQIWASRLKMQRREETVLKNSSP